MPVVFYILGIVFGLICANFTYAAVATYRDVHTIFEIAAFQTAQAATIGIALGSGVISAVFFSTGAIIETMRRRDAE
jgi:hypothetical protein